MKKTVQAPDGVSLEPSAITYTIQTPTFAILTLDDERLPMTIPANASIHVLDHHFEFGEKALVQVEWNARLLLVFVRDLQLHAKPVQCFREH